MKQHFADLFSTLWLKRLPKGGCHQLPCSKQSSTCWTGFMRHICS